MASQWTPPADGTPCWINIFATDVSRARAFYSAALGWKFRKSTMRMDGTEEDPSQIAHFDLGSNCPAGGITKVGEVTKTKGRGGNVMYLYVSDLAGAEKSIIEAGGKKMTDVVPEGKNSMMQHFEDTEGNYFGTYCLKK